MIMPIRQKSAADLENETLYSGFSTPQQQQTPQTQVDYSIPQDQVAVQQKGSFGDGSGYGITQQDLGTRQGDQGVIGRGGSSPNVTQYGTMYNLTGYAPYSYANQGSAQGAPSNQFQAGNAQVWSGIQGAPPQNPFGSSITPAQQDAVNKMRRGGK